MNVLAREDNERYIQRKRDARYETAILVAYQINTSGTAKVKKSPEDVYKTMKVETVKEAEEREEIQGPRRRYKGSLKSQFEQHEKWLEEQKTNGGNL